MENGCIYAQHVKKQLGEDRSRHPTPPLSILTFQVDEPVALRGLHSVLCSDHADFWQLASQYLNERSVSR